ncbi:hypothetical protein SCUCBS95973_001027 [Sporothrix curviconia]|uniref:Uncharacterized protein n=1 Tax=Sporothrix curviconia TaxID=1260050 RepID=A0ABP0AV49_9PEZI
MSPIMMTISAARKPLATAAFSTGRVLRSTADHTAVRRGGIVGFFPRHIGWGGALTLFTLGVADGALCTTLYFNLNKE